MEFEQPKAQDKTEEEKIKNDDDILTLALKYKDNGNAFFKEKKFEEAISEYAKGIELIQKDKGDDVDDVIGKTESELRNTYVNLLNNRSNCYNLVSDFKGSLSDCERAIKVDPKSSKAHYRRGIALSGLKRFDDAVSALNSALEFTEGEKEKNTIKKKILEINNKKKKMNTNLFFDAIHVDSPKNSSMTSSVTFGKMTSWESELDRLGNASRGWWRSSTKRPSEIFAEKVEKASKNGILSKENLAKITDEGERLLTVDESYSGPKISSPPTFSEVKSMVEYFKSEQKMIHKFYAARIIIDALKTFKDQPPLVDVTVPENAHFTVCGDVHGQFYDLLHIFEINGWPSKENPYLFNGDFVDRGSFSCEVLFTLLALRACEPQSLFMARGNHESINMNLTYGFFGEVEAKCHSSFKALTTDLFDFLPLAHVLSGQIFVVHGGLYMDDQLEPPSLDEIRGIDRVCQPPEEGGLMSDLLWADPQPEAGRTASRRGIGYSFGPDVTKRFLEKNGLKMVVRSHEVKDNGYEVMHDGRLVTVFSAPNYCDSMGNKGAFVRFEGGDNMCEKYTTFDCSKHPSSAPMQYANPFLRFMNGF